MRRWERKKLGLTKFPSTFHFRSRRCCTAHCSLTFICTRAFPSSACRAVGSACVVGCKNCQSICQLRSPGGRISCIALLVLQCADRLHSLSRTCTAHRLPLRQFGSDYELLYYGPPGTKILRHVQKHSIRLRIDVERQLRYSVSVV